MQKIFLKITDIQHNLNIIHLYIIMNPFGKIYMGNIIILINFIIRLFRRAPTIFWAIKMSILIVMEFSAVPKTCTNSFPYCIKFI